MVNKYRKKLPYSRAYPHNRKPLVTSSGIFSGIINEAPKQAESTVFLTFSCQFQRWRKVSNLPRDKSYFLVKRNGELWLQEPFGLQDTFYCCSTLGLFILVHSVWFTISLNYTIPFSVILFSSFWPAVISLLVPQKQYLVSRLMTKLSIIWKVSKFSSFFSFCFLLRIRFFLLTLQQS